MARFLGHRHNQLMKISIISSHAPSLVKFRLPFILSLVSNGNCVYALAPNYTAESRSEIIKAGAVPVDFKLSRAGMNPFRDLRDAWALACLLRRLKPDLTLAYFIKPVIYGTLAAWLARVPRRFAMIEGLGFVFTPGTERLSLRRRLLMAGVQFLYKLAMSKADRVIFLNPDDQAEFVGGGLLSQGKSFLLGGIGVDLVEWAPVPAVVRPVTFMLIARLLREKGVFEFSEAARRVKKRYPETRFVLLGDVDPNPGSLPRHLVQGWVDDGVLEWPGHVPVVPWLAQASVYVLPSYREGVPMSTQEAMAMGRAVMTTDVPGCRETVVDGVNGFLVPARNAPALAAAMRKFIEQPHLIAQMGRESRRLAEERFDVHKVNRQLIELIIPTSKEGPQP